MSDLGDSVCFNCGCSCDNTNCLSGEKTEIKRLREEIEKLKGQSITTLNDYREEVKMRLEAQTERDNLLQEIEKLKAELKIQKERGGELFKLLNESEKQCQQLISDLQSAKSRLDELVKSLEGLPVSMIDAHPVKMFNDDDKEPFIHKPFIDELVSKAKGQANERI